MTVLNGRALQKIPADPQIDDDFDYQCFPSVRVQAYAPLSVHAPRSTRHLVAYRINRVPVSSNRPSDTAALDASVRLIEVSKKLIRFCCRITLTKIKTKQGCFCQRSVSTI